METELHALVTGRVQGVGFRQATAWKAQELGLTGWVRNMRDGRVETVLQGSRDAVDAMLEWLHSGPPLARVDNVESRWTSPEQSFSNFDVRYY